RQPVDVDHQRHGRIPYRQAADLNGRIQIPFHGGRRDIQQIGNVVEAAGAVIGRQQDGVVHLLGEVVHGQKIADRVAVFGAGQAVQVRQVARIRVGGRGAVQFV